MTEPESSRSIPEGAYDVFLSFRGEDTRKTFTDHLYTALVQAGIHTFRDDDELPRGEEISKHLLKAIQESKIFMVVFSKGYASSRWCLDELVEILTCKKRKTAQIFLPIFYDIDPSDVRKQTGSFAEAFDKHEERFKEKVKEWRKALEEAGNISGWNLNDMENKHEAKFIQEIIKNVLNRLDPRCLNVPDLLVGIDPLSHSIFDFISTATDDVRIVGIHGMPGVGKTTIAKVLFNKLCYRFEGSSFLSNINETSEQFNGLVHLQKQLLCDISKQDDANINSVDRGMVLIKERLRRKRVLVVVDDVAHMGQLNSLLGERSWFGPGSRAIITTRDERLLLKVDRTYRVAELERDGSLQLFCWHAFRNTKPEKDCVDLSNDVVDYCGGLPLALEVLGSCLFGKKRGRWEGVIDKLRRIPNLDIQKKLRISFSTLDYVLQNAFLDIACFFVGRKKGYVEKVLEARCGYNPEDDLGTLVERSLIKINGWCEINMHDLLRDMGREIVREKSPDHPGKRSRIWQHEDAWNVLNKQKGTKVVEGLTLDVRASEVKSLSTRSFTKMRCLKLLQINGIHLNGPFKLLSEELIWICWVECPMKSFPSDLTLHNLVVLEMQYSDIKELWQEKKILNKLKILNLSYSKHLVKTPNLHSTSLERLMLEGCSSLVEVHQSVGHLKSLVFLNLKGCWRLKILPQSICAAKSLEILDISGCSGLERLPECMSDMESLIELLVDGIENEQLLSSIGQLKYVRKISFRGYNFNQDSPWLSFSSRSCPSSISSSVSASVFNWKRLLQACFVEWRSVKCLNLADYGLSEFATNGVDFGGLSSLEELNLSRNKFFCLPSGIGVLPKLQLLTVNNCSNLVSISELPSNLESLDAFGCASMERVRMPIQSKTNPHLYLEGCPKLIEIKGMENLSNHGWCVCSYGNCNLSNNYRKSLVEALCNGGYGYHILSYNGERPHWLSYRGDGCSLSFYMPPVFQGLVVWVVCPFHIERMNVIIKNKSNSIQLFETILVDFYSPVRLVRYTSKSEMAMDEYRGDEELELCVYVKQFEGSDNGIEGVQCGIHVIVEKTDSFEGSETDHGSAFEGSERGHGIDSQESAFEGSESDHGIDIQESKLIPSPPYHLLHHPLYGSISSSTIEQWKYYLLMEFPLSSIYQAKKFSPDFS